MGPWPGFRVQKVIGVSHIQNESIVVRGTNHGGLELALASEPRPAALRSAHVVSDLMGPFPVRLISFIYVFGIAGYRLHGTFNRTARDRMEPPPNNGFE
jgi:hypothetical protein